MNRRTAIKVGLGALAGGASMAPVIGSSAAQSDARTAFVLVHGSWHGGWCWARVEAALNMAGFLSVAIDLPGHGLDASIPESFGHRPLDAAAFANEPSSLAGIGIDRYADAVIGGVDRALAMGADRVFVVGHSMGGVPLAFAAAKAPDKLSGLIYLAALAPTPGKPAGAYLQLEDQQANSEIGAVFVADPAIVGALRMDPRSTDDAYRRAGKAALAADVDDALWATVLHLLTPDAPAAIYGDVAEFPPEAGGLSRTFIRCALDRTLLPSTCEAIVADMDRAWPSSPTTLVDLESSHEAMFSSPDELAALLIAAT